MGFIENPREAQAAVDNGWLDEQGRVTAEAKRAWRLGHAERADPNRPVSDVLREIADESRRDE